MVDLGFKTDKGVKRSNNEDAFFILRKESVFIVADGVGGNRSGEIASRTAVNEVAQYIEEGPDKSMSDEAILREAVDRANYRVYDLAQRYEENQGMATTMVIALMHGKNMYIANVGDSRAYLYRKGELKQISVDHTYVNELVKAGVISADEAKHHVDKNMITKAVGAENVISPDIFKIKIKEGDCILLCTDGLYGELSDAEIKRVFDKNMSMTDTVNLLVDAANENGGGDNITAICIRVMEDEK